MRFEKSVFLGAVAVGLGFAPHYAIAQTHPDITVLDGLEISGASLDASEIETILLSGQASQLARLIELDADRIAIDRLEMARPDDILDRGLVLSGIVLSDVSGGVAGSITIDGLTFNDHDGGITYDAVEIDGLDFGLILGFADVIEPPRHGDFVALYDGFRLGDGGYDGDRAKCSFGTFESGALEILAGFDWELMDKIALDESLSEDERETLSNAAAFDMFAAFRLSHLEMGEIFCSAYDPDRGPIEVLVGGFSAGAFEPGLFPAITIENLDYTIVDGSEAGTARFGMMAFDGMDYAHLLGSQFLWPDADGFERARRTIPHIFGFSIRDAEMDIPDGGDRIAVAIEAFDMTLDNWVNGLPTSVSMSIDNQTVSLASSMDMFGYDAMLSTLGLDVLSSSFALSAHWDPDAGTIVIDDFRYDWPNLGSVALSASLAGADEALWSYDSDEMLAAARRLGLFNARLELADHGVLDVFSSFAAFDLGLSGGNARAEFAGDMIDQLNAELDIPGARAVVLAIADFIRDGGRLVIEARASGNQPAGMESFDAIDADPAALFEVFDIKATVRDTD